MPDQGHGKPYSFTKQLDRNNPLEYDGATAISLPTQLVDVAYFNAHPGTALATHENITIPGDGDTSFTLGGTPVNADRSILMLRGVGRKYGVGFDYTISGNVLTWDNNNPDHITLKAGEDFQIWYNVSLAGTPITNSPMVVARLSGPMANVTGDNVSVTVKFDDAVVNLGGAYVPLTGIFTAPTTATYLVLSGLRYGSLTSSHTHEQSIINATGVTRYLSSCDPGVLRNKSTNQYAFGGGATIKMTAASTLTITTAIGTASKTISILTDSYLSIYLLGAA